MPNLDWNRYHWVQNESWTTGGEEWSEAWGGSEAQWWGSLFPRLHRALPARGVLEIAPGFGRWTKFLLPLCERYVGIDLSPACISACRNAFAAADHASFFENDGLSLDHASADSFDLVFSFDSLVHCEQEVLDNYIPQILQKLTPSGLAFIHHSNLLKTGRDPQDPPHHRAISVSADAVAQTVASSGGKVLVQEIIDWGHVTRLDGITLFGHAAAHESFKTVYLENHSYMAEAALIRQFQSCYSTI